MSKKTHCPKPRNPYVAAAKFRRAGAHEKTEKARRRHEAVALIQAIRGSRRNGGGEGAFRAAISLNESRPESPFAIRIRGISDSAPTSGQSFRGTRVPITPWMI